MDTKERIFPTHIVAVAGIVTNDKDEVLLVNTYNAGWVFPGGQVEVGELFCVSSNVAKYPGYNGVKEVPTKVILDYVCKAVGGTLRSSEENSESGWFAKEDALKMIQAPAIVERYKAYLEYTGRPAYLVYVARPVFELKGKSRF